MSNQGRIAVLEILIREEQLLVKECETKLAIYGRALPSLERNLESSKNKLEELLSETRKGRLQQNSGSGGKDTAG